MPVASIMVSQNGETLAYLDQGVTLKLKMTWQDDQHTRVT